MCRQAFLTRLFRNNLAGPQAYGPGTSIVCQDLMAELDIWFPAAHTDPAAMAGLAMAGHTVLGFDVVMPLFSVCHEAAALGCKVDWGHPGLMPEARGPICTGADDFHIPADLLTHPGCAVPLTAIRLLKHRLAEDAAVCGKVMGPWTLAYHCLGLEDFLIGTVDDPAGTRRLLDALLPVTIAYAHAQLDAGADCILLADHATRDLCSPDAYQTYLAPIHTRLVDEIPAPLILHICGNTSDRIHMIAKTGLACFHWDTKTGTPSDARHLAGDRLALMGGVSNVTLLSGTPDDVAAEVEQSQAADIDIIAPECAIPLTTPLPNLKAICAAQQP